MSVKNRTLFASMVLAILFIAPSTGSAQYCTTPYWYPCSYYNTYINSFSTSGGTTNISSLNTACSASSGYIYYSTQTHTGAQGTTVSYSIINNPYYTLAYGMYVDFNGDGDFTDAGEQVYASSGVGAGSTVNSTFTIPATATVGTTRLRLRCDYVGPISPCGIGYYGECEDYKFVITIPCPAKVTTQPNDTAVCTGNNASFTVAGNNINTYQWEVSTNSGSSWSSVSNGGVYSNATSATLMLTAPPIGMDDYLYRCKVTNTSSSCFDYSSAGKLIVNQTPEILTTTPGFACTNGAGQVSATATTGVTVRWYDQSTGGTLLGTGNTYSIASASSTKNYYAEPYISTLTIPGSISTSTANNGQVSATFDCKPLSNMTVTGFDFTPRTTTTYTASIYYRVGTMVGNTGSSSGWTLLGTTSSFSATANVVTAIPLTLSLNLSANTKYAFYVNVTGGTLGYTNGTGTPGTTLFSSNSDMEIYEGYGSPGLFSSSLYTTRTFAGTIHYTKQIVPPCTNTNRTAVSLTVDAPPVVNTHPTNVTICNSLNTTFSVGATNVGGYQWQLSTNGGSSWTDISNGGAYTGATSATLNITGATTALNANQYRCKVLSPCNVVGYSNAATLTINPPPSFTASPTDKEVCVGGNTSFSVAATGFGGLTYQWEYSSNGGSSWNTVNNGGVYSNATTATLSITGATLVMNSFQFRCVVTGTCAPAATSTEGILTVGTAPTITTQPTDKDGCPGSTVTFSCASGGIGLTYQWQEYTSVWTSLSNGSNYSGVTTNSLDVIGVTPSMTGKQYRCVVSGTCSPGAITDTVTLNVNPVPNVSGASNSPVCEGQALNLTSSSSTSGVTFGWTGPASYSAGTQNPTIGLPTVANSGNYIVTATITATGCTATATVPVVINVTPVITAVTGNDPVCTTYDIELSATANSGSTYSWTGPASYIGSGQTPKRPNATIPMTGYYKVLATLNGCVSKPDSVMVTVIPSPTINAYPSPGNLVCDGDTIAFFGSSSNTGIGPIYQWLKNGQPIAGENALKYIGTGFATGDIIKLRMTPGAGVSCNSDLFTVDIPITSMAVSTPTVTITVDPNTPVWEGLMVTFTATTTGAGNNPKYQWKVNGKAVEGATSDIWSTTTLTANDIVTCEVESNYECSVPKMLESTPTQLNVLTTVNGVRANTNIALYPNPNKGLFTLKGIASSSKLHIEVLNAIGQVVYKDDISTAAGSNLQTEINLGQVADGIYLLKMTEGDVQSDIRFRVQN